MTSLQPSLRRLLNRRDVTECLAHLEPLAVALVDFNGRTFVTVGEVPERDTMELSLPLMVAGSVVGYLVARGSELEQPVVESAVRLAHRSLNLLLASRHESRSLARETLERYREINLLYSIGETIGATLDPDAIPHLILAEAGRVINADAGAVFLKEEGELRMRASVGASDLLLALQVENATEIADTSEDGLPCILTREQLSHPRPEVTAVVCAPLKTREQVLGLVMLGRLAGSDVFTASDQKLLSALAGQTAIAIENARLFADVKDQRDAIAEMKNYMDNIFASIASGVITTDISDLVTILNRAAERILGVRAEETMGRPYTMALPQLSRELAPLVSTVKQRDRGVFGYEMESVLPERGPVNLRFHLSPLKDHQEHTTGIAIVVDDLTEQKQLEAQIRQLRGTFERYVSSKVVEEILSDPSKVRLGGVRQEVSILFADVRGFTSFSEGRDPEVSVEVLNRHLTLVAEAVLDEDGTLDKFMGDAVMAVFNAPLAQPDHALRAVRAAWRMQQAITEVHHRLPEEECLRFGIGIVTGPAVVGNVGSPDLQNYTAIGDSVNLASRLQTHAGPGQILLDTQAYERVRQHVIARDLGYVQFKGYSEPDLVFELIDLRSGALK